MSALIIKYKIQTIVQFLWANHVSIRKATGMLSKILCIVAGGTNHSSRYAIKPRFP